MNLVMGAGQSLPSQNQPPSKALHVLRVTPSSPASKTTIEPYFDFVVGFEGDAQINNIDAVELEKIVESHEGKTLNLVVWSSKDQESRGANVDYVMSEKLISSKRSGTHHTVSRMGSNRHLAKSSSSRGDQTIFARSQYANVRTRVFT